MFLRSLYTTRSIQSCLVGPGCGRSFNRIVSRQFSAVEDARPSEPVKVTAAMIKELRQISGSPLMECKKVLSIPEVKGDLSLALEELRKRGVKTAAKMVNRNMNEGLIGLAADAFQKSAAMVEVSSETDFVARNDHFNQLVAEVAKVAWHNGSGELNANSLAEFPLVSNPKLTVKDALIDATAKIKENIGVKNAVFLSAHEGYVGTYRHNKFGDFAGTQCAMVVLESSECIKTEAAKTLVLDLSNCLAMHLVGGQASFLDDVPQDVADREAELETINLINAAKEKGDPEKLDMEVVKKRAEKKVLKLMKKMKEEQVFLNQDIISSNPQFKGRVSSILKSIGQGLGTDLSVTAAVRFTVGKEHQTILRSTK